MSESLEEARQQPFGLPRQPRSSMRRIPRRASASGEPVGAAGDQCFKYVVEDANIDPSDDVGIVPTIKGVDANQELLNCVYVQSASLEKGKATLVVCCRKQESGKCTNCRANFTIVVYRQVLIPDVPPIVIPAAVATKAIALICREPPS